MEFIDAQHVAYHGQLRSLACARACGEGGGHGPVGPWGHGPKGHGPMGPWADEPMGPGGHGPMGHGPMGLKRASAIGSRGSRSRFVNQLLTKFGNATLYNSHTTRASRIGVSTCGLDDRSRPPPESSQSNISMQKQDLNIGVSVSRPSKMETDTLSTEQPHCNSHTKHPPESGCQLLPPAKWKPTPRQRSIRTAIPPQKTLPNRGVSFFRPSPPTGHPYCNSHTKDPPKSGCQFLPPTNHPFIILGEGNRPPPRDDHGGIWGGRGGAKASDS